MSEVDPKFRRPGRRAFGRLAWVAAGLLALTGLSAVPEQDAMVLVVARESPVHDLDAIDLKRLFLGIPVVSSGANLRGVLNYSDLRLRALFYQHVMGMTEEVFERRALALTIEQGRQVPTSYRDEAALLALVMRDRQVVSFAWKSRVAGNPQLRMVRELWHP